MVRSLTHLVCVLLVALVFPSAVWAEDDSASDESVQTQSDRLFWIHAIEEYRGRFAIGSGVIDPGVGGESGEAYARGDESDHDARLFLTAGIRDRKDRFSGRLSAALWWDADGFADTGSFSTLGSLRDEQAFAPEVYTLYGEYHANVQAGRSAFLRLARAGRQTAEYGLPATFDGAHIRIRPMSPYIDVFAFGGRTVHFFESDADLFEDWIASGGVEIRPMRSLRLVVDYRFLTEDIDDDAATGDPAGPTRSSITDHSYGLAAWYKPCAWSRLKVYGRGLTDEFSHVGGAGRLLWPEIGLGFDFKVDAQVMTLNEVNEMLNPYFAILGRSEPNVRWKADIYENLATSAGDYGFHLGWIGRALLDGHDGPFNREFGKLYFLFAATDIGVKGPFVNLIAEAHFTGLSPEFSGDEGFLTAGGSAGYEGHGMKAEVGTFYHRYKYRYYQQAEEISDVRTYFGSFGYTITDWLKARVRYEFDQFDWDVHTVIFSLSQSY